MAATPAAPCPAPGPEGSTSSQARCPRCGAAFHCGFGATGPCACAGVALSTAQLEQLRQAYQGCLCPACLRAQVFCRADS